MNSKSLMRQEKPRWHSVWCKPRQEAVAEANLQRQGFHVYLPRMGIKQRRHGHWVDTVAALFPRYLFIRMDPFGCNVAPVRSTRGVIGLVRFGRELAVVPDVVMEALSQREDSACGLHQDNRPLFGVGEAVKLVDGPLAGMEGSFAQEDGDRRVSILLELLGRTHTIRVSRDSVARAE